MDFFKSKPKTPLSFCVTQSNKHNFKKQYCRNGKGSRYFVFVCSTCGLVA